MAKKIAPWDPVVDCIEPLIEALNPLKFSPPLYSCPDLAETYRKFDVEMCYLWLQNCMSSATATDFKNKLDSCLHHWVALVSPERWSERWGWNVWQWQDWWNESTKDNLWWKETWDEVTDEFQQAVEYLEKLVALIEAKVATRKRKGQGSVRETEHSAEASNTDTVGNIKKRFSFKKVQAFFDGKDLGLPTAAVVNIAQILRKLVKSYGVIVEYNTLDEHSTDTASDALRQQITTIRVALKKHKVPCSIRSKTWSGYMLCNSHTHS